MPGIFDEVKRAAKVRVRAQDRNGQVFERDYEDILAVCIQHEMDHLDGRLFVDYLSDLKRERIRKKLEKERASERAIARTRVGCDRSTALARASAPSLDVARRLCGHAGIRAARPCGARRTSRGRRRPDAAGPPERPRPATEASPVKPQRLRRTSARAAGHPQDEAAERSSATWRPDVLVVVAYGLILPREVLALPRLGCINIHASLLPRWRGAAPIQRAILAGDSETGVTIMQMDAGLDTGPVLLQRRVAITRDHTGGLAPRRSWPRSGPRRCSRRCRDSRAGTLDARAAAQRRGRPTPPKIDKAEAHIDWQRATLEHRAAGPRVQSLAGGRDAASKASSCGFCAARASGCDTSRTN